jgi:hypothetical protein
LPAQRQSIPHPWSCLTRVVSTSYPRLPDTGSTRPGIHSSCRQQGWRPNAKDGLLNQGTNDQPQIKHTSVRCVPFLEVSPLSNRYFSRTSVPGVFPLRAEPFPLPPRILVISFPEKVPHDFLAAESHFRIPAFSPVP